MFCKYCGKELTENALFCSRCGGKLVSAQSLSTPKANEIDNATSKYQDKNEFKFCKFCGKQLATNATFCSKCGKQLIPLSTGINAIKKDSEKTTYAAMNKEINIDNNSEISTEKIENQNRVDSERTDEIKNQNETILYTNEEIPNQSTQFFKELESIAFDKQIQKENSNTKSVINTKEKGGIDIGDFSVKDLFVQVFKKHAVKERDEILKAGIITNNEVKITSQSFQPWLYSRVFLILLAVFGVFEIGLLCFNNSNLMPAVMLTGSLIIPFSLLTMYFELNVYRDISFYKTIGIFLLGGAISLLFTLLLYAIFPSGENFDFLGASLVSIIEEIGKVLIVIILLNRNKSSTVLHGLLIGGAIGCGFAVFESAGYAFNVFLNAHDYNTRAGMINDYLPWYLQYDFEDSIGAMNFNIFLRSILSFGGHTAWAAIEGAAFAKEKKLNIGFIKMFAACLILHTLWDTNTPAIYFKLIVLCLLAWVIIIHQITKFVEEDFIFPNANTNNTMKQN